MRQSLLAIGIIATVWACGGTTFVGNAVDGGDGGGGSSSGGSGSSSGSSGGSSGSSSGSSSGGGSGSSSGGGSAVCPASPPSGGGACPMVGLECEYGSDPNPACNDVVTCTSSGWSFPTPGVMCPTGTCPATYADVPQGKECSPQGLDCAYTEGECNCADTLPVSQQGPVWQCVTPPQGCPEPRPRLGSACSQAGLSCDYGACTGGIALVCTDGYWQQEQTGCPI